MNDWGDPRSKTISCCDPAVTAAAAMTMSGMELLRGIADGTLPPPTISRHLDLAPVSVAEGDVVFTCTPDESSYNRDRHGAQRLRVHAARHHSADVLSTPPCRQGRPTPRSRSR